LKTLPTLIAVLVLGIIGTLFTLSALGRLDMPGMSSKRDQALPAGHVNVLVASQRIPAFTSIGREHLIDPRTMNFAQAPVPRESASKALSPGQVIGRVLARDKGPGWAFQESDFLPEGTREGVAAGVPPGLRAVVLEANKIQGAHSLKIGDHFDLVSSVPVDAADMSGYLGPVISSVTARQMARMAETGRLLQPVVLVKNGMVIRGVTSRQEAYTRRSGLVGATVDVRYKPIEEISLAIDPSEVVGLTQALMRSSPIIAVTRSGRPDNVDNDIYVPTPRPTPTPVPVAALSVQEAAAKTKAPEEKITVIQTISGAQRNEVVFREQVKN